MTKMQIVKDNPFLHEYSKKIEERRVRFNSALQKIEQHFKSIDNFTISYKEYGLHQINGGIYYREWAPNAKSLYLAGDFNNWNLADPSTKCDRDQYGVFTLFLPDTSSGPRIKHNTRVRCFLELSNGEKLSRIPAWINYTVQNKDSYKYDGVFWNPPNPYEFKHKWPEPRTDCAFLIYEAHIGMAGPEPRVHTFNEFTDNILPIVKSKGYNVVQLMGVMEHSYYASAGYQVTSFFSPSSRFGTPEDLMRLIDTAHSLGLYVFLDTIHSHASKNIGEGINQFDGTDSQYFHPGKRGIHPVWDSRLFDYSNIEVQRFLLSNLRYYIDVFHFDGFRFDGIGSMIYKNQGVGVSFDDMGKYFGDMVDEDAITYLYLANYVVHRYDMFAITTAEDVSGMVGVARKIEDGGFGFDFRLGMGGADLWVQTLEKPSFDDWNFHDIVYGLTNRPVHEKTIAYTECHDQPFPIAYRFMGDKEDEEMSFLAPHSDRVENGIALLKMIRLLTFGIAGEAYLNFMGNEFGHPGKIEFPHNGNHDSFANCIRRFELADDEMTRYASLKRFDQDMLLIEKNYKFLNCGDLGYISAADKENKVIAFEKAGLLWVFNFNPSVDFESYVIGVGNGGRYSYIFSTDDFNYAGQGRVQISKCINTVPEKYNSRENQINLKLPTNTAFVLRLVEPDK